MRACERRPRRHGGLVREHRRHRAAGRPLGHEPAAGGDQPERVVHVHHAGHAGRRVLADAVADDRRRLHAPRPPQRGQRPLHREQRRLRVLRLGEEIVALEQLQQRDVDDTAQPGRARVQRVTDDGLAGGQPPGHGRPLRPLTREQERDAGPVARGHVARRHAGRRDAVAAAVSARPASATLSAATAIRCGNCERPSVVVRLRSASVMSGCACRWSRVPLRQLTDGGRRLRRERHHAGPR